MKTPSQRNNQIFDAYQNKIPVKDLSQKYGVSHQRIRQIIRETGVYRLRADLRTLCEQNGSDSQALDLYQSMYACLGYQDEDILTIWQAIQKGCGKLTKDINPRPDITTLFTQTLQKILGPSQFNNIQYSSRVAMVPMTNNLLAKVEFIHSYDSRDIYDAIQATVLHKARGRIDSTVFYLNEIIGAVPEDINPLSARKFPMIEHVQTCDTMSIRWQNIHLTEEHYTRLRRAITLYLRAFL